MLDFRKSGKPVYAYLEYGGDREYYLATAADRVFLMPSSPLDLKGLATYEVFLRGTLDKIGAYPDMHHIGDYKTAPNQLTEKGYTRAHKEMDESLNRDLYEQLVRGIADGRRKNDAEVRRADRRGAVSPGGRPPCGPRRRRGVRGSGRGQAPLAAGPCGQGGAPAASNERLRKIEGDDYARVSASAFGLNRGPRIGVIYATGTINARPERLRSDQRRRDRRRHAHRLDPAGQTRQLAARDRHSYRQPRRVGDGVRRDLARAHDRQKRSRRPADRRVDVRSGRVGRVLHRVAGARSSSRSRRRSRDRSGSSAARS